MKKGEQARLHMFIDKTLKDELWEYADKHNIYVTEFVIASLRKSLKEAKENEI